MTNEVYDKMKFTAKIHGCKFKTPSVIKEQIIPKKTGHRPEDLDKLSQNLFQRMKQGNPHAGK